MKLKYFFLFIIVLLNIGQLRAEVLSRAEAVAAALNANPGVLRTRQQLKLLDGRITEERSNALPDISTRGTMFRYNDPSLLNSSSFDSFPAELRDLMKPVASNMWEGGIDVRQTLYSFKVGKAIRAARLARTLGGADLRRAQQEIALETVKAYNALLYATEQVRVQRNALERKEKHLEITRNRREAGVATELEVLRSQVDVENQRAEVTRVEGGVDLARAQLNALMLRPMDTPITPSDTLQYVPADFLLEDVLREAMANRPDLEVAELTESVRQQLVGVAKAESKPSVDFVGSYGRSTRKPENFLDRDFTKWSTAISIKFPIFDGKRTAGRVAQAEAEVGKAKQDKIALQNQVRLQAMDALVKLNVAGRLISAAQLNVEQARKALDMTQANYNYGAATILDVTDAQNALVQAENTLAIALQQHADARATVNFVMGHDPVELRRRK
ncbi:MAG TPA: TolC family protein [Terriglobales bacterium]|nr:TolC family protein [Terriglobales bacterium]